MLNIVEGKRTTYGQKIKGVKSKTLKKAVCKQDGQH